MMKFCLASAATMAFVMATTPAMAYTGQELSKQAKVSITEARAIALKAHPGKITDEELEKEKGGTGLRYSFDIKRGGVTTRSWGGRPDWQGVGKQRKDPIQTNSLSRHKSRPRHVRTVLPTRGSRFCAGGLPPAQSQGPPVLSAALRRARRE